jgi:YD repeat-containing protein
MPGARSSLRAWRAAATAAVALAFALGGASAAQASLLVDAVGTTTTETSGNGDGLVGPGDTFSLTQALHNSESSLTGIQTTLTSTTPGVTVGQGSSAYPDMTFGGTATNTTPFSATVPDDAECGIGLDFNLHVKANQGSDDLPLTVGTGTPGPPSAYDSLDVPRVVPNFSTINSTLTVPDAPGRLKDVRVRIGQIDHAYVSDLRIELIAPDGTSVLLVNRRGADGDDFTNTVFTSDPKAPSIVLASAPFTGEYQPEGDLSALVGKPEQGVWKLRISDQAPNDVGTLQSWGLDLRTAVCDGRPVASFVANPNPALPDEQITLDGSDSTDPNGTVEDYAWDLDGDGTYETDTGTTPTVQTSYPTRGAKQVGLQVTDDTGAHGTVTHVVSVTQAPTADLVASPTTPSTGQDVTLDASKSNDPDPGGAIVDYKWDLDGDGTFERDTGATATTTTQFAKPGTQTVRVKVTDQDGATAIASAAVDVQNALPTASFTAPAPAVTGTVADFDASGSTDSDGTITGYEWDLDGNGTYETDTGSDPHATHTYSTGGDVLVGLRVTDNDGGIGTTTKTVRVTRAPTPSFTATPNPVGLNTPVDFDASASSDPEGPIARYEWDLDGNGSFETDTGTTPTTSHSYPTNGTYPVKLRVTDGDGATATATVDVTANNGLPLASLGVAPNPAVTGQLVTLDASGSSDPDGSIVKYDWDLDGNGSFETPGGASPTVSHAYPNPGGYDVGVRVTDNNSGTGVARVHLVVSLPTGGGSSGGGGGTGSGGTGAGGTGTGGSGSGDSGGGAGADVGADDSPTATVTGSPIQRLRTVLRSGLAVGCGSDRPMRCTLTADLAAREARRLGLRRRAVRLGVLSLTLTRAGTRTARLRLTAAGRRALRRARRVTIVVDGRATDGHQLNVALSRAFLIRR